MAYYREPIYSFSTLSETGIDKVPLNKVIIVKETGLQYIKISNNGITSGSTVGSVINSTSFVELSPGKGFDYKEETDPSISTNPDSTNVSWFNTSTGEIFICSDNTPGSNTWFGNQGTFIGHFKMLQPGDLGFGVGIAPDIRASTLGLTGMPGYTNPASDNFGNYQDSRGSIFVYIPKFYFKWTGNVLSISDNSEGNTHVLHRAFINAGQEQDGFFISKYHISNENGIAVSKKLRHPLSTNSVNNPITNLTSVSEEIYASAILASKDFGSTFHCSSIFQLNALALIAYAAGKAGTNCAFADVDPKLPKGNNNNALADVNDTSVTFTSAGNSAYPACALTGSGSNFAKTTHNGQNCGVADVNGNMWRIAIGLTRPGTSATDTAVSGTNADFYVLKESYDIASLNMTWSSTDTNSGSAYGNTTYLNGSNSPYSKVTFDGIVTDNEWKFLGNGSTQVFTFSTTRTAKEYISAACGIPSSTGSSATGTTEFGNDGIYNDNQNNLQPLVSGDWVYSGVSGVFAVSLSSCRGASSNYVGFSASTY